jgi:hypothetical protein
VEEDPEHNASPDHHAQDQDVRHALEQAERSFEEQHSANSSPSLSRSTPPMPMEDRYGGRTYNPSEFATKGKGVFCRMFLRVRHTPNQFDIGHFSIFLIRFGAKHIR